MAKAYWVNVYQGISDQNKFQAYAALAGPAIESAGGRFMVPVQPLLAALIAAALVHAITQAVTLLRGSLTASPRASA